MATVVIIHAAEDALPARALADKLRSANLNPVIEMPPGDSLRGAIDSAAVTLALWSPRAIGQQPLLDDAGYAKSRGRLVHARMQNTPTPPAFVGDISIDLTGWRGEDDFAPWRDLLGAVTQAAGVPTPPAPAAKGPASFFSPGRPSDAGAPPPAPRPAQQRAPQAPRPAAQASRPAPAPRPAPAAAAPDYDAPKKPFPVVPAIIAAVLIFGGIGGYFVWKGMQGAQTTAAWDDVPRNDADALRAFIADNPGAHREDAEQALRDLEEQSFDAAQEEDTIDAFEGFLNEFPDSDHAIAARGRIAELRSMPPVEDTSIEALPLDTTTLGDPDLLPPDAASQTVEPDTGAGPATLTPPITTDTTPLDPPPPG